MNKHIPRYLFWSGGADSTYLMIRAFEEELRVDKVFFSDTGMEFPEMYDYIQKVETLMLRKYGVTIHKFQPKEGKGYKDFSRGSGVIRKKLQVRGIPRQLEPCWLQRNAKVNPFEQWVRDNKIGEHLLYIGYTADELKRAKMKVKQNQEKELNKINDIVMENERIIALEKMLKSIVNDENKLINNNHIYPLILWNVDGDQVKLELQERGILNPLYKHFDRTGCFMCPKVGKPYYFKLWKHYPIEWKWMKKEEKKLHKLGAFNSQFNKDQSLKEMELEFKNGLYDVKNYLRDTEEKDFCFCVI